MTTEHLDEKTGFNCTSHQVCFLRIKWQVFVSISPYTALLVSERFVVLTKTGSWSLPVVMGGVTQTGEVCA